MDLSQIIYAIALASAIWWGGPDWRLSALCVANFVGTMILAASPIAVGVLDAVTIAVLIVVGTWRGYALAGVFAILVPIYPIAATFGWPDFATYTIVDIVGVALLGVLASGDGGYGHRRRLGRRRYRGADPAAPLGSVVSRSNSPHPQAYLRRLGHPNNE